MLLHLCHSEGHAIKNVSFSKFCDPVTRLLHSDKHKIAKFHSAVRSFNNEAAHEVRVKTCRFFLVSILTVCMSLYVTDFASSLGTQSWLLIIKTTSSSAHQSWFCCCPFRREFYCSFRREFTSKVKTTEKAFCFYENHVASRNATNFFF